jgi:2-keto-4-pentenoate hydratase/2-oxohepta-3-ene-1,7-dioic acid hydratase in catechol pathway
VKIVRVQHEGTTLFGQWRADGSVDVFHGDPFSGWGEPRGTVANPHLLAPVVPACVIGIGLNYRDHAIETGAKIPERPVVFLKNPACVTGPYDPIRLPRKLVSTKVDSEAELAVVIGKAARDVSADDLMDYVLGFTCGNDVSARDWQKEWGGGQWSKGKSFDTFCPLGPCIVTPEELGDPHLLAVESRINGEPMQSGNTKDMIFSVGQIIEFLSADMTLLPGTVILTGTPAGVGMARTPPLFLQDEDTVEVSIEGIGMMRNLVSG